MEMSGYMSDYISWFANIRDYVSYFCIFVKFLVLLDLTNSAFVLYFFNSEKKK